MVTATGTTSACRICAAGQRVQIKGVGSRFSGTYFVTETTHTIGDRLHHQFQRAAGAADRGAEQ